MSIDRDFYQLVDSRTRVLNTARSPGRRLIEQHEIEARFGVTPAQWCDRVSLVGDPSDGIRGVHGVGPVAAARLLANGLMIEQLATSGRCTGRVGERVLEEIESVLRWRSMVRLRSNLRLPEDAVLTGLSSPELPPAAQVLEAINLW